MTTRVAIYARVSTGEQNAEAQLRELRAYLYVPGSHGSYAVRLNALAD